MGIVQCNTINATFMAIGSLILKYLPHVGYTHMYRTSNKEEDPGKLYVQ